ncbi:MAG: zinc-dependent alcohol dehydrogenase [Peptococcales bacterium]|jgi:(R,R)-butanediol dehydrogenase/meso-butanediol dehydrogenase/diacetyl reductase
MKAVKITSPGKLELVNEAMPVIKENEALVKVSFGGICGSDLHIYHGKHERAKYPVIMCHEFSGEIVTLGEDVKGSWAIGDKVAVNPLIWCGICDPCTQGNTHVCNKLGLIGIDIDGAFAQYVKVKESQMVRLPDGLDMDTAALAEPLAVGVHAVVRSNLKVGDKVVILGGGPIGLMLAFAAQAAGAGLIAISEISEFRLKKAEELGFKTINAREKVKEKVMSMTNGIGADIVFEAAAAPITTEQMTGLLRTRGTAMIVGVHRQLVGTDLRDVNLRELNIRGTRVYTQRDFETAVNLLPKLKDITNVITHRIPLEECEFGFQAAVAGKDSLKVLIKP